jgi:hypothetical protein
MPGSATATTGTSSVATMTETATSAFSVLDTQITEALAELRGARLDYDHCPSIDAECTVEYAELRLNRLIDRRRAVGG